VAHFFLLAATKLWGNAEWEKNPDVRLDPESIAKVHNFDLLPHRLQAADTPVIQCRHIGTWRTKIVRHGHGNSVRLSYLDFLWCSG